MAEILVILCTTNSTLACFLVFNSFEAEIKTAALRMNTSVACVINQLKNLTTQFGRLVKCPSSGSGAKRRTARQEWIVKQLDFLRPFYVLKSRDSISSANFEDITEDSCDETLITLTDETGQCHSEIPDDEAQYKSTPNKSKSREGPYQRQISKKQKQTSDILESIARSLDKPIEIKEMGPQPSCDEDDLFGNLIALKLKKIQDPRVKAELTAKILQLTVEAEISTYNSQFQPTFTYSNTQGQGHHLHQGGYLTMLQSSVDMVEGHSHNY